MAFGDQESALKMKELEVIDDFSQIVCGCELWKLLEMGGALLIYTHGAWINVIQTSAALWAVLVYTSYKLDTLFWTVCSWKKHSHWMKDLPALFHVSFFSVLLWPPQAGVGSEASVSAHTDTAGATRGASWARLLVCLQPGKKSVHLLIVLLKY